MYKAVPGFTKHDSDIQSHVNVLNSSMAKYLLGNPDATILGHL